MWLWLDLWYLQHNHELIFKFQTWSWRLLLDRECIFLHSVVTIYILATTPTWLSVIAHVLLEQKSIHLLHGRLISVKYLLMAVNIISVFVWICKGIQNKNSLIILSLLLKRINASSWAMIVNISILIHLNSKGITIFQ